MDVPPSNTRMVMIRILLISITMLSLNSFAGIIEDAFKSKDYQKISDYYKVNQKKGYDQKQLIIISYSLKKLGFFRQDINLNIRLVKKLYPDLHKKLMGDMASEETVDSDDYPQKLQIFYWNILNDYAKIIEGYSTLSPRMDKDMARFSSYQKILGELEFREAKVDKINGKILSHQEDLKGRIYKFSANFSIQYVSWQKASNIKNGSTGSSANLIITNKGTCTGGDLGYENSRYHFYVDGCFIYGSGDVSASGDSSISLYQQSNIPAMGIKFGPGASMIVSSSRSRIGFKLPVIYTNQKLETPASATKYIIDQGSSASIVPTIYSRWQFDKWFIQTEFGQYFQETETFWGLGIGRTIY